MSDGAGDSRKGEAPAPSVSGVPPAENQPVPAPAVNDVELPLDTAQLQRMSTAQLLIVHRPEAAEPTETIEYQETEQRRIFSVVAAVTGILGLCVSLFVGWAVPFSLAAIAFGVLGRRREQRGRTAALVGIVTGVVGTIFAAVWIGYYVVVLPPVLG